MSLKSILLLFNALVLSTSLLTGCGGGSSDAATTDTTTTDTTTNDTTATGTGEVTFSGAGTSVIPTSFTPIAFNDSFSVGNETALFWSNNGGESKIAADIANNGEATYIDIFIIITGNVVTEINVGYTVLTASTVSQTGWIIDNAIATINSTYDGTTVTFAGETLLEEFGAAGDLVINGSLGP